MPKVSFDHDKLESALSNGADEMKGTADSIDTSIGGGLDPQTAGDLADGQSKTAGKLRDAADSADKGRDASKKIAHDGEEGAQSIDNVDTEHDKKDKQQSATEGTRPVGGDGKDGDHGKDDGHSGKFEGIPGLHDGGDSPKPDKTPGTEGLKVPSPGPLADNAHETHLDPGYYDAQRLDEAQRSAAQQAQNNAMAQAQAHNAAMSQAQAAEAQSRAMQAATAQQLLGGQGLAQGGASPAGVAAMLAAMDNAASGPDYGSTGDPGSASESTQFDLNHADNKEELREQIYQQLRDAYDRGELDLDSTTHPEGEAPGKVSEPNEKAAIKLAQDYASANIPYAWGGGHGAEPGISQGTSDGGGAADQFGDYMKQGLDCSGLSRDYLYNLYGIDIGGTAADQMAKGQAVSSEDIQPGDLWFPHDGHVGVYIGNGQILEAQQSGTNVHIRELSDSERSSSVFRRINPDTV